MEEEYNNKATPVWRNENSFCISFVKEQIHFFDVIKRQKSSLNIHIPILAIILLGERFAILMPNQKIHVLSDNMIIISSFDCILPFSTKNILVENQMGYLFVNDNEKLFISKAEYPISFQETNFKNYKHILCSPDSKHCVISYKDGSILLHSFKEQTMALREKIYSRQREVIYMFWLTNNQVCIVYKDGLIVIHFIELNLSISRTFYEISKSYQVFYSSFTKKLYMIYNNSIKSISFCFIHENYCIESDKISDVNTMNTVFDINSAQKMFPLRNASKNYTLGNYLCYKALNISNTTFTSGEFLNGYYFAVDDKNLEFNIFKEGKFVMKFPSLFIPSQISAGKHRLTGFHENLLLVIDFIDQIQVPRRVESTCTHYTNEKLDFYVTIMKFRKIIKNSVCANDEIYIHFDNNIVVHVPTMKTVSENANLIWREQDVSILFVQKISNIELHYNNFISKIEYSAISASNGDLILVSPDGTEPFVKVNYCVPVLINLLKEPEKAASFIQCFEFTFYFSRFIRTVFASITSSGNIFSAIRIIDLLSKNLVQKVISSISPSHQTLFIRCGMNLIDYIDIISNEAKIEMLLYSNPKIFHEFYRIRKKLNNFNSIEATNIIKRAIDMNQWSRAIRISHLLKIDIAGIINSSSMQKTTDIGQCIEQLGVQSREWANFDEFNYLTYLGCAFIVAGFENWGISSFIVAKNEIKVYSALERLNFSRDVVIKYLQAAISNN